MSKLQSLILATAMTAAMEPGSHSFGRKSGGYSPGFAKKKRKSQIAKASRKRNRKP